MAFRDKSLTENDGTDLVKLAEYLHASQSEIDTVRDLPTCPMISKPKLSSALGQAFQPEIGARAIAFLRSLLNPEEWGYAVTPEVRDEARAILGLKRCESRTA